MFGAIPDIVIILHGRTIDLAMVDRILDAFCAALLVPGIILTSASRATHPRRIAALFSIAMVLCGTGAFIFTALE